MIIVLKELFKNFTLILHFSKFQDKSDYQNLKLGIIWKYLNPFIQTFITYLVFAGPFSAKYANTNGGYASWLIIGMITWTTINSSITQASKSIFTQITAISKTRFPISTLPAIMIYSNLIVFWVNTIMSTILLFIFSGGNFNLLNSINIIEYIYYNIALVAFLYPISLFAATFSVVVRDFHISLTAIMRILFLISGVFYDFPNSQVGLARVILKANPFNYLIEGFRHSIIGNYSNISQTNLAYSLIFWGICIILFVFTTLFHIKYRENFSSYI